MKNKPSEEDRKERKRMRKEIQVMNNHLRNDNKIESLQRD